MTEQTNRRTGRTYRMIQAAREDILQGKDVYIAVSTSRFVPYLQAEIARIFQGIQLRYSEGWILCASEGERGTVRARIVFVPVGSHFLDLKEMTYRDGTFREGTDVLRSDHSAIEAAYRKMLDELHRYDE